MTERYAGDAASLRYPPFAGPGGGALLADDLPLIEQFIDELPSIDDYRAEEASISSPEPSILNTGELAQDSEGWANTGWQSYDWTGLASLGRHAAARVEADTSWNATEWSQPAPPSAGPTADEVAAALDGIAHRIRSGELSIDQLSAMPPEAAMAAALAAMMRLRG